MCCVNCLEVSKRVKMLNINRVLLAVSVIMGNVRENEKKKMNVGIIRKLEKDRAALGNIGE